MLIEMLRNFAYVFIGIAVVLGLAKTMGIYEKQLKEREKEKIKYTLIMMGFFSTLIAFGLIWCLSFFFRWPAGIKYIVLIALAVIVFNRSKTYIESSISKGRSK